ncbi:hypothetical protein L798_01308 [Zootermopsis nevadensis]|uniref:Uncharacterized protein n=1 Tax=Zootermopsis nevadensis TaxID=136037 RepID=A0A067RQ69_ZOONE|nr:hypothetical protein L798_01308 [Zootermopsis nevadensis]
MCLATRLMVVVESYLTIMQYLIKHVLFHYGNTGDENPPATSYWRKDS